MIVASVVVLAHNEAATIGRALGALAGLERVAEVVVVCNGCTDGTAAIARRVAPWATTIELDIASKPAALRAGDDALTAFPRLYLDADVVVSDDGVRQLAAAVTDGALLAVAPTPRYDVSGASPVVRGHYRVWTALQEGSHAVAGTGAMMVNTIGRERFGRWPDVIADDYFLDGQFAAGEKARLPDLDVVVRLPRTWRGCVSRRARVAQGNREVDAADLRRQDSGTTAARRLVALIRSRPRLVADVPAHLLVIVATRATAWWRRRRGTASRFYRDESSR